MSNGAKLITIKTNGEDGIVYKPELSQKYIVIGSDINCDIRLINAKKLHAKISLLNEDKSILLINNSKSNPVKINSEIVKNEIKLNHNDIIEILEKKLRWENEAHENAINENTSVDKTIVNKESTPNENNILKTPKTEPVKSKYKFSKLKLTNISDSNARKLNLMSEKRFTYHKALGVENGHKTIFESNEEEINNKCDEKESSFVKLDEDYPLFQKHRMPIHASTPMCNKVYLKNDFKNKLNKLNNSGTLLLSYSSCNENDTLTTPKRNISTRSGRTPRTPGSIYGTPKSQISNLNTSSVLFVDDNTVESQSAFFKLRDKAESVDLINFSKNCTNLKDKTLENLDESIVIYKTPDVTSSMYLVDLNTPATTFKTPLKTPNKATLKKNTNLMKSALKNLAKSTTKPTAANSTVKNKLTFDDKTTNQTMNKSKNASTIESKSSPHLIVSINKSLNKSATNVKQNKSDCIIINDSVDITDEIKNCKSTISEIDSDIIIIDDLKDETLDKNETVKENSAKNLDKDKSVNVEKHETDKIEKNDSHLLNKTFEIEEEEDILQNTVEDKGVETTDIAEKLNKTFEIENASFTQIDLCSDENKNKDAEIMNVLENSKNVDDVINQDIDRKEKTIMEEPATEMLEETVEINSTVNTDFINEPEKQIGEETSALEQNTEIENKSILIPVVSATLDESKKLILGKDDLKSPEELNIHQESQLIDRSLVLDKTDKEILMTEDIEILEETVEQIDYNSISAVTENLDKSESKIVVEMDVLEITAEVENKSVSGQANSETGILETMDIAEQTIEIEKNSIISPNMPENLDESNISKDTFNCINEEEQIIEDCSKVMDKSDKEIMENVITEEMEVLEQTVEQIDYNSISAITESLDKSENEIVVEMDVLEVTVENKSVSSPAKTEKEIVEAINVVEQSVEIEKNSIISPNMPEHLDESKISKDTFNCINEEVQFIENCSRVEDQFEEENIEESVTEEMSVMEETVAIVNKSIVSPVVTENLDKSDEKIAELLENAKTLDKSIINPVVSEISDSNPDLFDKADMAVQEELHNLDCFEENELISECSEIINESIISAVDLENPAESLKKKFDKVDVKITDDVNNLDVDQKEFQLNEDLENDQMIDEFNQEIIETGLTEDLKNTEVLDQTEENKNTSISNVVKSNVSIVDNLSQNSVSNDVVDNREKLNHTIEEGQLTVSLTDNDIVKQNLEEVNQLSTMAFSSEFIESDFSLINKDGTEDIEIPKDLNNLNSIDENNQSVKDKSVVIDESVNVTIQNAVTDGMEISKEIVDESIHENAELSEELNNLDRINQEDHFIEDCSKIINNPEDEIVEESVIEEIVEIGNGFAVTKSLDKSENEIGVEMEVLEVTVEGENKSLSSPVRPELEVLEVTVEDENKSVSSPVRPEKEIVEAMDVEEQTVEIENNLIIKPLDLDETDQRTLDKEEEEEAEKVEEDTNNLNFIHDELQLTKDVSMVIDEPNNDIVEESFTENMQDMQNKIKSIISTVESDSEPLNDSNNKKFNNDSLLIHNINSSIEEGQLAVSLNDKSVNETISKEEDSIIYEVSNPTYDLINKSIVNSVQAEEMTDRSIQEELNNAETEYTTNPEELVNTTAEISVSEELRVTDDTEKTFNGKDMTNYIGLKEIMNTPKCSNNLDDMKGVKEIFNTPHKNELTDLLGVKEMMNTPSNNNNVNLVGIKDIFKTPKDLNNLTMFDGVKELVKTPKINDKTLNLTGINELLATPNPINGNGNVSKSATNDKSKFKNDLYKTAIKSQQVSLMNRYNKQENEKITEESVCETTDLELTKGSKSFADDVATMESNFSSNNSPIKNPNTDAIMVLEVSGRSICLSTSITEIMTIEPEVKQQEADDDCPGQINIEKDVKTMDSIDNNCDANKSAENLFDEYIGKRIVKYTYGRKNNTHSAEKQLNLTADPNVTLDLPKTDIELWLNSVACSTPQAKVAKPLFFEKRTNPTTQILSSFYSNVTSSKNETSLINQLNEMQDKVENDDVLEKSVIKELSNQNHLGDSEKEKKISDNEDDEKKEEIPVTVASGRSLRIRGKKANRTSDSIKVLKTKKIKKSVEEKVAEVKSPNVDDKLSPSNKTKNPVLIIEPVVQIKNTNNVITEEVPVTDNVEVEDDKPTKRSNRRNKIKDEKKETTVKATDKESPKNQKISRKRLNDEQNVIAEVDTNTGLNDIPKVKKSLRNKIKIQQIDEELIIPKMEIVKVKTPEKSPIKIKSKELKIILSKGKRSLNNSQEKLNEENAKITSPSTHNDSIVESPKDAKMHKVKELPQKKQKKNLVKSENITEIPNNEPSSPKRKAARKKVEIVPDFAEEQKSDGSQRPKRCATSKRLITNNSTAKQMNEEASENSLATPDEDQTRKRQKKQSRQVDNENSDASEDNAPKTKSKQKKSATIEINNSVKKNKLAKDSKQITEVEPEEPAKKRGRTTRLHSKTEETIISSTTNKKTKLHADAEQLESESNVTRTRSLRNGKNVVSYRTSPDNISPISKNSPDKDWSDKENNKQTTTGRKKVAKKPTSEKNELSKSLIKALPQRKLTKRKIFPEENSLVEDETTEINVKEIKKQKSDKKLKEQEVSKDETEKEIANKIVPKRQGKRSKEKENNSSVIKIVAYKEESNDQSVSKLEKEEITLDVQKKGRKVKNNVSKENITIEVIPTAKVTKKQKLPTKSKEKENVSESENTDVVPSGRVTRSRFK